MPGANVKETRTSQRTNSNSFNNNKLLALQDGCDMNARGEEDLRAHIKVTQYRTNCLLAQPLLPFK